MRREVVRILSSPIAGGAAAGIAYALRVRLDIAEISVKPAHVIILLLWLAMIESFRKSGRIRHFPLMTGLSAGIVGGYFFNHGLFSGYPSTILVSSLAGLIAALLIALLRSDPHGRHSSPAGLVLSKPGLWSVAAVLLILAFRLLNIITRHSIPNEERSLMIAGTEVHHLITGFFFAAMILAVLCSPHISKRIRSLLGGFLVLYLAMIADQLTYVTIYPLTDQAFFGITSTAGAIIGGAWLLFRINFKKAAREDARNR